MKKILFVALLSLLSTGSLAESLLENRTPTTIFSENQNAAGFYTSEGLSQCMWGIMFIDLSNEAGRAQLSLLLVAKTSGLKIVRMDYYISDSKCYLSGMHIL